MSHPAKAIEPLSISAVNAAIAGAEAPAAVKKAAFHGGGVTDAVYSALLDFAQKVDPTELSVQSAAKPADHDSAYSALQDFAKSVGAEQPIRVAATATKAPVVKGGGGEAYYLGNQACMKCHTPHEAAFAQTVMGKLSRQGKLTCETCHGPGSAHVKAGGGRGAGGIISFRVDDKTRTVQQNNAICLGCHEKGNRLLWQSSTHESRDVACTNCHTIMKRVSPKNQLKTVAQMDTCFQCHKNKRAEIWRSSHMPIREGKVTCSDCHNPHGTFGESLLKEATINETCYKCHAEKRGPYLWEHAPVRESCVNCHDPHGSVNEFLLKISRPRLCQQCHSPAGGHPANPRNPQSVFAIGRECQNCHSQHHGSNSPSGARFQR